MQHFFLQDGWWCLHLRREMYVLRKLKKTVKGKKLNLNGVFMKLGTSMVLHALDCSELLLVHCSLDHVRNYDHRHIDIRVLS